MRRRFAVLLIFGLVAISGISLADSIGVITLTVNDRTDSASFSISGLPSGTSHLFVCSGENCALSLNVDSSVTPPTANPTFVALYEPDGTTLSDYVKIEQLPTGSAGVTEIKLSFVSDADGTLTLPGTATTSALEAFRGNTVFDQIVKINGVNYELKAVMRSDVVPEPGTLLLFGTGVVGLVPVIRRKLRV